MKSLQILLSLMMVVLLISCASGISKKDREMLHTEALVVLNSAIQLDDPYVKSEAVDAMRDVGDRSFVPGLLESLYDTDDIVVMKAARALGEIGDTTAIPELEFTLALDPDFTAQKASAVALYRLGEKDRKSVV